MSTLEMLEVPDEALLPKGNAMGKWFDCLELLHWLRGFNAATTPDKRVPERFLNSLASVLGDPPPVPPDPTLVERVGQLEERLRQLEMKDQPLRLGGTL